MGMHKLGVEEWLVSAVISVFMHRGTKTAVRTVYGKCFDVKVVMHQRFTIESIAISDCHRSHI